MTDLHHRFVVLACLLAVVPAVAQGQDSTVAQPDGWASQCRVTDVDFQSHDGFEMFGRLVLPKDRQPRAIVVYVQTAEGATVDQKRPLRDGRTFNYFDLYRSVLPEKGIGFFSYEGRGIRMGDAPPRYEHVDWDIFRTATLDNKVKDALSAVQAVRSQPGLSETPVILMGASEGTLIAAEVASHKDARIDGLVLYATLASNMRQNFAFILSDGSFLPYRRLDTDHDGSISEQEWDVVSKYAGFDKVDRNGDGVFNVDDMRVINKKLLDAVDNEDFDTLQAWAKTSAAVVVPDHWFEDHFSHADIWSFLKESDIPVGVFHGDQDSNTSIAAVKELQQKAKEAGRTNLEFHYFEGLDHTLNIGQYFVSGKMPEGHQVIFRYIDRISPHE